MLAIVPLAGLVVLTLGRLNDVRTTNQELSELNRSTTELVRLIGLESALQDEGYWAGTAYGVAQTDFPPAIVTAVLGVDPAAEAAEARARADDLVETVVVSGVAEALEEARATAPNLTGEPQLQERIAQTIVADALLEKANDVVQLAGEQPDGADLVALARMLQNANDVRTGFAQMRTAFYASFGFFETETRLPQIRRLSAQHATYQDRLVSLQSVAPPDPETGTTIATFIADPDRIKMVTEVEAALLASDGWTDEAAEAPTFISIAGTFVTSLTAATRHLELVEDTATALKTELADVRSRAERDAWILGSLTAAISLMTIGAIVATTRWIVRPLAHLGRTAHALAEGGQRSLSPPSGPAEIRLIHDALTEAMVNLERAEQQAIALADGVLDDPALSQAVPGRFGATLHTAIEQLRRSIGHQQEYRDRLAHEAGHDPLTGVLNRRASLDVLRVALERREHDGTSAERPLTIVFFVDLDHFKQINDSLGHAAGDDILRAVADGLRSNMRPGDEVGRIGGDEFLVISTSLTSTEQAIALAERFLTVVTSSISTTEREIAASVGLAVGDPGRDVDELLAEADVAMLEAKRQGRNRVRLFDDELRARTLEEMRLAVDIRSGLATGEFRLHYQPIIDTISGRVRDYEALIRWEHPDRGLVPPNDFIPFAESSDLILEIDRWVMKTAVETIASGVLDGIGLAINVSGRHLAAGDVFADLQAMLEQTPIDPSALTVEVTESALLGDVDRAIETLRSIRDLGMKVAIDDFGTGYTSLTNMRSLPVDVLKIDQTFTANLDSPDDAQLVQLVIQTAHILGLDVIVEGVETLRQAQRVTILGADLMQGYLFARPLPLGQIERGENGEPITTNRTASHR
jgi:diguanylate cyclase (GGDEF)-like protein